MDRRLDTLISQYHARVAEAVALLEAAGLSRPSSHAEWAFRPVPQYGDLPGGFRYFKHGVGCRVEGPEWTVDFNFGPGGEINGIDPDRLHRFSTSRAAASGLASVGEIEDAIEDALRTGDLVVSSDDRIVRGSANVRQSHAARDLPDRSPHILVEGPAVAPPRRVPQLHEGARTPRRGELPPGRS